MKLLKPLIIVLAWALTALLVSTSPHQAYANPDFGRPESLISEITLGDSTFRLSTDRPAIPTTGGYSYLVEITPGRDLLSVNLRIQLSHEENGQPFHYLADGIYIEHDTEEEDEEEDNVPHDPDYTDTDNDQAEPEIIQHVLQRRGGDNLDGLGMTEGVYHVAVIVTATTAEGVESATLRDLLVVFDPERPELNLMPVVHLSALPLRDSEGVFNENPTESLLEEKRAALEAISTWIHNNPRAQLTLAISPLFLDELNSVARGQASFKAQNGNGEGNNGANNEMTNNYNNDTIRQIPTDSLLAQRSARTLEALQQAHNTGRLVIIAQGYADPNPTVLASLGLSSDIALHYTEGLSVLEDTLGIEPANITAPWTQHFCAEYLSALEDVLPQATIIIDSNTRGINYHTRNGQGASPLFRIPLNEGGNEILLADAGLSSSLSNSGSKARFISQLLDRRQETTLAPLLVRSYDDVDAISELLSNLELLSRYAWINLVNVEAEIDISVGSLSFNKFEQMETLPAAVKELQTAREALLGLRQAFYEPTTDKLEELAHWNLMSLASFAGPGIELSTIGNELLIAPPTAECAILAAQVYSYVQNWFSDLEIHAQTITFSGSGGMLPVTVLNNSDQSFYLDVKYVGPSHNVAIEPEHSHQLFPPGETFLEPNIELRNIISGSVDIQLWAGEYLIAEESVRVSATYADRIAIIVVVALAGTGLAFYVWRRVSKNNTQEELGQEESG